jgi:hypothetical protein
LEREVKKEHELDEDLFNCDGVGHIMAEIGMGRIVRAIA